jgi:inner membrane protein
MASAFGHVFASLAISQTGLIHKPNWKIIGLGFFVSVFPDADSLGFAYGIPYNSFWGHRGFSHSIVIAGLISGVLTLLFRRQTTRQQWALFFFLFLSCISHALLDAMTSGGLGVAFLSPFDNTRYFFPFRPIQVSPISVAAFFEGKGLKVIRSEAVWIGLPGMFLMTVFWGIRALYGKNSNQQKRP